MKRLAVGIAALAALVLASPASAASYSEDARRSATLDSVRHCAGPLTVYDVELRNDTRSARYFRAVEVRRGVKLSDRRHRVPRRTNTGLLFYVPSGETRVVTVTHRSEVLLHRRLRGICY